MATSDRAGFDEFDTDALRKVDGLLHQLKSEHSRPPGNATLRLLHRIAFPVCAEVQRREVAQTRAERQEATHGRTK